VHRRVASLLEFPRRRADIHEVDARRIDFDERFARTRNGLARIDEAQLVDAARAFHDDLLHARALRVWRGLRGVVIVRSLNEGVTLLERRHVSRLFPPMRGNVSACCYAARRYSGLQTRVTRRGYAAFG
jgi:hypothetical protein